MRWRSALILLVLASSLAAQPNTVRGVDTPWTFPEIHNRADWAAQAARIRTQILFHAGLWPMPPKTPLNPQIFGRLQRNGYSVEKVYFESVPGFYVTGNLYRPVGKQGPFPGVIC